MVARVGMVTLGKEARGVGDTIWTAPHLGVPKCLWHLFTRTDVWPLSSREYSMVAGRTSSS
jgi:hypothetical protein